MPTLSTTFSPTGSRKFMQDQLIKNNLKTAVTKQLLMPVSLKPGDGKTAYMNNFPRIAVPTQTLTEGVTPRETPMSFSQQSVTVDHYGLYVALTDVGVVVPKDPVLQQALALVADAITRLEEYTNLDAMTIGGTTVTYWDGTRANRAAITSTDVWKESIPIAAKAYFRGKGAPAMKGTLYVALTTPEIIGDIGGNSAAVQSMQASLNGSNDISDLRNGNVGNWRGFIWMESNMLPVWTRVTLFSPTATTGGSLSGTVYHKVTRISTTDGFEDEIQVEGSTAMGADTRLTFTAPSTSGYVYRVYAGTVTGDANLFLAKDSLAPSETYYLDAVPASGRTPPATPAASVSVHPIYILAAEAGNFVDLNAINLAPTITPPGENDSDPLGQRRKVGAKWSGKMGVRDQSRLQRIELASNLAVAR